MQEPGVRIQNATLARSVNIEIDDSSDFWFLTPDFS